MRWAATSPKTRERSSSTSQRRLRARWLMAAAKSVSPATSISRHAALVARGEPQHEPGREPDRGGGRGIGRGRRDLTAVQHGERRARTERPRSARSCRRCASSSSRAQLAPRSRWLMNAVAAGSSMGSVTGTRERGWSLHSALAASHLSRRLTADRESATLMFAGCRRPASPSGPLTGFSRCQISLNGSGSRPAASRISPEKRTLTT